MNNHFTVIENKAEVETQFSTCFFNICHVVTESMKI